MVAHVIVEHECNMEACEGAADRTALAALLELCLALHIVTLKEEDWVVVC